MVRLNIIPYFVLGLKIEKDLRVENGIADIYMKMYSGEKDFMLLQKLYDEGNSQQIRREFLRKFLRPFGFISSFVHSIILFQIIALLSASFVLVYAFNWSFFS